MDGEYGGFLTELDRDGSVLGGRKMPDGTVKWDSKAGIWHAACHEVRGCLNAGGGRWE